MTVGMNAMPILPGKPKVKIPKAYKSVQKANTNGPKKKYGSAKVSKSQRVR